MKFFRKLFQSKKELKKPENQTRKETKHGVEHAPKLPYKIELIPDQLYVKVFQYNYKADKHSLAYVTEGLMNVGQKELFFTSISHNNVIDKIIQFFKQVYQFAQQGRIVDVGGKTQFGTSNINGWKGIIYAPVSTPIAGVNSETTLIMIMLFLEEIEAAHQCGARRILSMLGKQYRFYPHPYWNETNRNHLAIKTVMQNSIVPRTSILNLSSSTATLNNNHISFEVKQDSVKTTLEQIPQANTPITILPDLNNNANVCLTWSFDSQYTDGITPDGSDGSIVGGCMLIVCPEAESNSTRILEDGFAVMMTDEDWNKFWTAFNNKKNFELPLASNYMGFSLSWN